MNLFSGLKNALTNDTGFFQRGKSFGGKGLSGMAGDISKKFKAKPYAGIPGVCPYSGKPLQTQSEIESGVSDEIRLQMPEMSNMGMNSKFGIQPGGLANGWQ